MLSPTNPVIQQALDAGKIAVQTPQTGQTSGDDFAQKLMDVMKDVNDAQQNASQMQSDFISGQRPVEYHDLMISMEKASTAMQLTMAVRSKVLDAYQEID